MSTLDYVALRRKLKAGRGVLIVLATKQTLYLTPLKAFRPLIVKNRQSILISLTKSEEQIMPGVFVWDAQHPPRSGLKLTAQGFPLHAAAYVHGLLCRIFFPIKLPKNPPLLLDYPRTKKGKFCKPRTTQETEPKQKKLTEKRHEPTQPTKRQFAIARRKTSTACIIEAETG